MPVTIGQLDNVPAPGDPIRSPWAQEISGYAVHPFPSLAALNAGWASPPNGSLAVALDTSVMYLRRGGAWEPFNPRPTLYVALSTTGQADIGATATDITGLTVTLFAFAGHRYLVTASLTISQQTTLGTAGLFITDGANVNKQQAFVTLAVNGYGVMNSSVVDAPPAGTITYKIRMNTNAGSISLNQGAGAPSMLIVQDLGP